MIQDILCVTIVLGLHLVLRLLGDKVCTIPQPEARPVWVRGCEGRLRRVSPLDSDLWLVCSLDNRAAHLKPMDRREVNVNTI